jgi:hypothetical protein
VIGESGLAGMMPMSHGATRVWILVMDPTRARIIRRASTTPGTGEEDLVMRSEIRNLRLVLDQNRREARHGAVPPGAASIHADERSFVRQLICLLETHRAAGDFEALAIVAETTVFDQLQELLPLRLRECISWQAARTRLDLSDPELPEHLQAAFNNGEFPC